MVCIDDKHRLKVEEPGFPVAAAERGRKLIVRAGTTFEVGDHVSLSLVLFHLSH